MIGSPPIQDMAATLLAHGVDLSNIPAAIMCLINAHYDARVVQLNLDRTLELARFDATVGAVAKAMGTGDAA
jgi:hypothetical protein